MTAKKTQVLPREKTTDEWLDDHGVKWHFEPEFPISDIDIEASLANQARLLVPLDAETVELYAESMINGDTYPPAVGYLKNGKLVLIDGNHRVNAWIDVGETSVPVFIVENADAQKIVLMTFQANTRHGLANPVEERIEHALWLIRNKGTNQNMAANVMNVKKSDVNTAWRKSEANRRAKAVGIKKIEWDTFAVSSKTRLASIGNDLSFKKAAEVSYKLGLHYDEINDLVTTVKTYKTATAQVKFLNAYANEHVEEATAEKALKKGRNSRYFIVTYAKGLMRIFAKDDMYENIADIELEEYKDVLGRLRNEIDSVLYELDQFEVVE